MSSVRVRLGGKTTELVIRENTDLLTALRSAGYSLPAVCGGRGKCGKCRVWINGVPRLACRAVVNDGDEIRLPDNTAGQILTDTPEITLTAGTAAGCAAAVDLGTTTVAVRLYDLAQGREIKTAAAWNAQAPYGGDVISRIKYTMDHPDGLRELSDRIRAQVGGMISNLLSRNGNREDKLLYTVLVGNTVMQHIFACLPVESIALAPFVPETLFSEGHEDVLLGAPVYYAPCVSGYVGGDITAGLLASGIYRESGRWLFMDIGTNGEMALGGESGFLSCAVASGPAFEGAGISCGMAAIDGAVSHVRLNGSFLYDIIGEGPARGLCGSGLIDLLAILTENGCIDAGGRLLPPEEAPESMRRHLRRDENGNGAFFLTRDMFLTAKDVRSLQLAKAAVAAGIAVLLKESGMRADELDGVCLAGGFGSYVNPASAEKIGMLPHTPTGRMRCAGNTALAGASLMAIDPKKLDLARSIALSCRYIELSGRTDFAAAFTENLSF